MQWLKEQALCPPLYLIHSLHSPPQIHSVTKGFPSVWISQNTAILVLGLFVQMLHMSVYSPTELLHACFQVLTMSFGAVRSKDL